MRSLMLILTVCFLSFTSPSAPAQTPSETQLQKLSRLADFLDYEVNPKKFNIQNWGTTKNPDDPNYVGCAGGWSTQLFAKDGVHYDNYRGHNCPVYKDKYGSAAMREFFGLTLLETEFLFSNIGKASDNPHKAAANIRQVVNKHRMERFKVLVVSIL